MIKTHFAKHYFKYNFEELCRLVKLIGYNHQKNDEFLSMIEDSLKIRIDSGSEQLGVTKESLKDLIEGISVGSVSRKRMNAQVRKLLKLQVHLFEQDPKLTIQAVALLSDYDLGKNDVLNSAVLSNLQNFTIDELSYATLATNLLDQTTLTRLQEEIDRREIDTATQASFERFALSTSNVQLNVE